MKNRAVRIALFLLVILAFAGAAYELAQIDRRAAAGRDAARAFDDKAREAETAVRELRAAQFAYVAAGQGPTYWPARGTALLTAISTQVHELDALEKRAAAAGVHAGAGAAGALDDLATVQRIDANVQAYVRTEQPLLAADLVFSDLREAGLVLATRLADGRRLMAAALAAADGSARKAQIATAAGAAVFAILVLLLLVPAGRNARGAEPAAVAVTSEPTPPPAAPVAPLAISRPLIDLPATATLCADFASVREPSEIAALLARAARLLDATGIIIWLEDTTRDQLRPALSFGYAPEALGRIRAVARDADNATALAYRERALRVVTEDPLSNGAIVAPLVGPDGCVGVMAAEIRRGGEADANVQAAATIIAAQLATLVAIAPAAGSSAS